MSWELDLTDQMIGLNRSQKKAMKDEIGKLIITEIERTTRGGRSPVNGENFKPLSPEYRALKKKSGKGGAANLHLTDTMIAAIANKNTAAGVKIEQKGRTEKLKLFNHNTGDTLKKRQVLPDEDKGEVFNQTIMRKVDRVVRKFRSEIISEKELADILRQEQITGQQEGTGVTVTLADVINGS